MVDWSDPATIEKAARATLSVGVAMKKMKRLFRKKRYLSDVDLLNMLVQTAIAMDAMNKSLKHLFKTNAILSKYVEAKQLEAESVTNMLLDQGDAIALLLERVERIEGRVAKRGGRKSKEKRKAGKKRKGRD